jgi:SAM-dependent methyltransferase
MSDRSEADAVIARYARRDAGDARYSPQRPEVLHALQERQRAMLGQLAQAGQTDLSRLELVEVGCGAGGNLLELLRLGFVPRRLTGIELLPERLAMAREVLPASLRLIAGDALHAPLAEASYDVVYVSTVFSSLLDDAARQRLAACIWQWLKPGGAVLWYDFVPDNPRNPDVRGVPLAQVRALFPQGRLRSRRVTLAPPLARVLARLHPALLPLANALPLLRTHRLAWIGKPVTQDRAGP